MRQVHRAGDKLFIDYSGDAMPILNAGTGENHHAEIFVALLGPVAAVATPRWPNTCRSRIASICSGRQGGC